MNLGKWILVCALAITVHVQAFVTTQDGARHYLRWNLSASDGIAHTNVLNPKTHAIRYFIASDAYSSANREAEINSVRACFDQWQAIPGTNLKFEFGGLVAPGVDINANDNTNVVYWAKTTTLVNGGLDDIGGALGYCYYEYRIPDNVLFSADIVLNGVNHAWSTTPSFQAGTFFIEPTLLHEIGHFVGLEHSPVGGASMLSHGENGGGPQTGLSSDEVCGARFLYPTPSSAQTLAGLRGQVTLNQAGILGAVVIAEDHAGNVVAGTVTTNGNYELPAMPPGDYQVRVSPLDPNAYPYLLVGGDISYYYQNAETGFHPTQSTPITLNAGITQTLNFAVNGGPSPFRITHLHAPVADLHSYTYGPFPVSINPGQSNMFIGVLSPNLPASEATLSVSGDGLSIGRPIFDFLPDRELYVISVPISVASNATPGMRTLVVQQGDNLAYANGYLIVLPLVRDYNFDGLDDNFQRRFFSLWTAPEAGPNADPDGDGFNNMAEYISGTDPTNAASYFKIDRISRSQGYVTLQWTSVPGRQYRILTRSDFTSAAWQTLDPPIIATDTVTQWSEATGAKTGRAYRLQVSP